MQNRNTRRLTSRVDLHRPSIRSKQSTVFYNRMIQITLLHLGGYSAITTKKLALSLNKWFTSMSVCIHYYIMDLNFEKVTVVFAGQCCITITPPRSSTVTQLRLAPGLTCHLYFPVNPSEQNPVFSWIYKRDNIALSDPLYSDTEHNTSEQIYLTPLYLIKKINVFWL